NHVLRGKINAGLKALKADGTIAKLQKKWFGKVEE
ncbi:MAG TPA: amino acid ABC transporter substrate-binding protein, partial [Lactobacillus sp.]|nr:amino acid ABC transporter substrate-binding protein [Lactobacillus sp.]